MNKNIGKELARKYLVVLLIDNFPKGSTWNTGVEPLNEVPDFRNNFISQLATNLRQTNNFTSILEYDVNNYHEYFINLGNHTFALTNKAFKEYDKCKEEVDRFEKEYSKRLQIEKQKNEQEKICNQKKTKIEQKNIERELFKQKWNMTPRQMMFTLLIAVGIILINAYIL